MKRNTIMALVFSVLAYGFASETVHIFLNNSDAVSGNHKIGLLIFGAVVTIIFVYLAVHYWLKNSR